MADLSTKKCIPCESLDQSTVLPKEQLVIELTTSIPQWKLKSDTNNTTTTTTTGYKLYKQFTAKNFKSAMDYLNNVGIIAEREGHHPDLHLTSYREVEIEIYTHSVGGVTKNDLVLARMIDREVKVDYSPKWLKNNAEFQSTTSSI